jgi:ribosomal protein S18 acetylase RimI-like enzyme
VAVEDTAGRAIAFLRSVTEAGAESRLGVRDGTLLRSPAEAQAYVGNQLLLDAPAQYDPRGLIARLDELQEGLTHRRAYIQDDESGARLHAGLVAHGWGGGAEVVMVLPAADELTDVQAEEVDEARLRALEARTNLEFGLPPEVGAELVRVRARAGAAFGIRGFIGLADDGTDAAHATLYGDGSTAQIEDVATLTASRGAGLATAVVVTAARAARDSGHDLVFLVADGDDWPRHFYARLGFRTITRTWVVQREDALLQSSSLRPPA